MFLFSHISVLNKPTKIYTLFEFQKDAVSSALSIPQLGQEAEPGLRDPEVGSMEANGTAINSSSQLQRD